MCPLQLALALLQLLWNSERVASTLHKDQFEHEFKAYFNS